MIIPFIGASLQEAHKISGSTFEEYHVSSICLFDFYFQMNIVENQEMLRNPNGSYFRSV